MDNLSEKLNSEQKQAVVHDQGPLLIVAGAGTGKTTVITQRIAHLINEKRCRPEEILALTFTDRAANEMEERVDKLLPYGYVDLWISTFHAFAERILHEHSLEVGLPDNFKLLNTTQQWLLVRQNLDKFNLDYYRPLGNPTKFIHALIRHFSRAKDECVTAESYLKYVEELRADSDSAEFIRTVIDEETRDQLSKKELKEVMAHEIIKQEEVANTYHTYQQLLLEKSALDFGDLINYCLKLFQERKNVLAKYRKQFKYTLVDEFQDTNYAQYELIKLLTAPKNNITVVGDDDQSIYKFRGASISNILQFKDDYPKSKEIFLNKNYRSGQDILDLSYNFIQQNNPYRLEVKLRGDKKLSKKLSSQISLKGKIEHFHGSTLADEIKLTLGKIIKIYNKSEETKWSDFVVLVRANATANDFIYGLEQANIPYNFLASRGLYSKKIILDILAYFKLLDDYHESPAMYRILTMLLWQVSHQDIINLNYWARRRGWSLFEACQQASTFSNVSGEGKEKINKILALIERHSQLARDKKNTTEIIQAFLIDSGYLKSLTNQDSADNRQELNYLNQFYKKIQEFEKENDDKTLNNFLAFIELELESGEEGALTQNLEEEGPDTVKIMTVHAAKGLEFKYVFIVGLVDKRFPSIDRGEPIELPDKLVKEIVPEGDIHLQEERRLFYVAMTRAKDGLYFTSADDYGGARKKKLSRFLTELKEQGFKLSAKVESQEKDSIQEKREKVKKNNDIDYRIPDKFSFTQLKAFENCPHQYRFAHVLRIPTKGKPQFSFGQTMHLTLQRFFQLVNKKQASQQTDLFGDNKGGQSKEVSWEELKEIYQKIFIDDWYPDKITRDKYYQDGQKSLKVFFEQYQKEKPEAKFLEYPFNLRIGEKGEYIIRGKVDRIDKLNKEVKIVDYKTGSAKSKLSAEDKEQLLIYQIAAQEVMREKVKELSFYYFSNNQEMNFLGTEKELGKVKEKIIKIIEEIREGNFSPKPGPLCRYCDFNEICEFRAK